MEHSFTGGGFLKTAVQAGAVLAAPWVVPGAVLGKDGAVPPSERIMLGGIGIGNRGSYDLGCFLGEPDVRFVAVCDVKAVRRAGGQEDGRRQVRQPGLRDLSRPPRAAGPQRHRRRADRHRSELARHGRDPGGQGGQGRVLREALHEEHRPEPGPGRDVPPHGPGLPGRHAAAEPAALRRSPCELARRGQARQAPDRPRPSRPAWAPSHERLGCPPEPEPPKEEVDWDLYLGPAAWRPFNQALLDGFNFEKGGGMVGGGVLEWGSHCVDLCQWAAGADDTAPVEYNPPENGGWSSPATPAASSWSSASDGWLPLGSCPVRFEGDTGWVETGDSGKLVLSSPALLAGRKVAEIGGYPATFHVRDFLNCVKSRGQPRANADVACHSHIACHAANIAIFLGPQAGLRSAEERVHRRRGGQPPAVRGAPRAVAAVREGSGIRD